MSRLLHRAWSSARKTGVVTVDLDGDGKEQTGWVLLYLHIAEVGRIQAGEWVETGDKLGHPSCEGGDFNRDTRAPGPKI